MQDDTQPQIVIGLIDFIYNVIVKCLYTCNASVEYPSFQKSICNASNKNPEDISDSKVNPARLPDLTEVLTLLI